MALDTVLDVSLAATLTKNFDLGAVGSAPLSYRRRVALTTGTGAGKADRLFFDERTLAASASEDLDLVGSLSDAFGDLFSPARIKMLAVYALPANSNNVVVGAASATQWAAFLGATGTMTLRPGAQVVLAAGSADATAYVSAAGSTDLLKVANSAAGSAVTYQVIAIGASA